MRTVLSSSPWVPPEWIAAHGLRPRRLQPRLDAPAPASVPVAGLCPYARALVAEALAARRAAAVVLTTTCDQIRRAAEWLGLQAARPVLLVNVPATWQTPASARMYLEELRRLGRGLEQVGGRAPSAERLRATFEAHDAARRRLRDALGLFPARRASEAVVAGTAGRPGRKVAAAGPAPGAAGAPPACVPAPEAGAGPAARRVPVAVVGGPLARGQARVFDLIEASGGVVVLDGTETGVRTLPAPLDLRRAAEDPLLELVDAYFGAIPDVFRRPDDRLEAWLVGELAASGARGVVLWRYVWCDLWAPWAARLRERTGLPVLDLDVSADEGAWARVAHRVQAFLEIVR